MKSYKDLDIYELSYSLAVRTHKLTLSLPKHETYEIGSQLRRASQSVKDNIVEGYGRRIYKNEFIRYLTFSHASLLETKSQLEMINDLYSLPESQEIVCKYDELGQMINGFINYVHNHWKPPRRPDTEN